MLNDVRKNIYIRSNWVVLLQYYVNTPSLLFLFDIVYVRYVQVWRLQTIAIIYRLLVTVTYEIRQHWMWHVCRFPRQQSWNIHVNPSRKRGKSAKISPAKQTFWEGNEFVLEYKSSIFLHWYWECSDEYMIYTI